jgi:hypothetical protein
MCVDIKWITLIMSFTTHLQLHAELSVTWRTTNCILLLLNVDTGTIITPLLTQKPVHG